MPTQILDEKLLRKLAAKTDKDIKYLREQITKRASRNNVSSQAYFVYWLKSEKVGAENYRKKLSSDIRTEILELTKSNNKDITKTNLVNKKDSKTNLKVIQIESINISAKPPLLEKGSGGLKRIPTARINDNSIFIEIKHLRTDMFHDVEHG